MQSITKPDFDKQAIQDLTDYYNEWLSGDETPVTWETPDGNVWDLDFTRVADVDELRREPARVLTTTSDRGTFESVESEPNNEPEPKAVSFIDHAGNECVALNANLFPDRDAAAEQYAAAFSSVSWFGLPEQPAKSKPAILPPGEPAPFILLPEGRTEVSNGRRLALHFGARFRYFHPWKAFLVWDGKRWAVDNKLRMHQYAKDVYKGLWEELGRAAENLADPKPLLTFCRDSGKDKGIAAMLSLVRSEPGVAVDPGSLDRNPWLLNVENGTLNLKLPHGKPNAFGRLSWGRLQHHEPAEMLTKLAPVVFDRAATCPTWLEFLRVVTNGDTELQSFLRRLAGYCLTGHTSEHVLPFLYGIGANGKSVFLNTLLALLGDDYAMKAPPDLLMAKQATHPTERADLYGKRLVAAIETEDGRRLAESLVKELTGGDKVRARRMRENFWEFTPTHKIWLAANHKPTIRGTDYGIWRRVKLVPFTVVIPPERQDKELPEKLRAELSGILNWALQGCAEWQANGLGEPDAVSKATSDYCNEMDTIGQFIEDCCLEFANAKVGATALYKSYCEWCEANGERQLNQTRFGTQLTERGFERRTVNTGIIRLGIGLKCKPNVENKF